MSVGRRVRMKLSIEINREKYSEEKGPEEDFKQGLQKKTPGGEKRYLL